MALHSSFYNHGIRFDNNEYREDTEVAVRVWEFWNATSMNGLSELIRFQGPMIPGGENFLSLDDDSVAWLLAHEERHKFRFRRCVEL